MCVSVCVVGLHVYFAPLCIYHRSHGLPCTWLGLAEEHDGLVHPLGPEIQPGTRKSPGTIHCRRRYCQKINIIKSVIVSISS